MVIDKKSFDEIQLALHAHIAARLDEEPELAEAARQTLAEWADARLLPEGALATWNTWFALPPTVLAARIIGDNEQAVAARRTSPFFAVLSPNQRWAIQRDWVDRHPRGGL